jgi:hypothetical protein
VQETREIVTERSEDIILGPTERSDCPLRSTGHSEQSKHIMTGSRRAYLHLTS